MEHYACRFGPEFGDAYAVMVNETGALVNSWVSSGMGYARLDIVRGTEVPQEAVVWLTPPEFKAKFPQLYEDEAVAVGGLQYQNQNGERE